jgi:hypothetical protein
MKNCARQMSEKPSEWVGGGARFEGPYSDEGARGVSALRGPKSIGHPQRNFARYS